MEVRGHRIRNTREGSCETMSASDATAPLAHKIIGLPSSARFATEMPTCDGRPWETLEEQAIEISIGGGPLVR